MNNALRYPGGKTYAIKHIIPYFPKGIKELCSPFFGGGSIELYLHRMYGVSVYGYDNFKPLIDFYNAVQYNKDELISRIEKSYPLSKFMYKCMQHSLLDLEDTIASAAVFFILNRASFGGLVLNGGMGNRFSLNAINNLKQFEFDIPVKLLHFRQSILKHTCLIYADPPYFISRGLYGDGMRQDRFNHRLLATMLNARNNFIVSYNDCDEIRTLYKEHTIIELNWTYCMNKRRSSNEILIISKDL